MGHAAFLLAVPAVLVALATHCNGSGCTLDAANYGQTCSQDSDCVAVFSGNFCGSHACACENAAINVSSQAQYERDFQNDNAPRCPCPSPPPVACNQGACGLRASSMLDAGESG